jgi:hypothetical protein
MGRRFDDVLSCQLCFGSSASIWPFVAWIKRCSVFSYTEPSAEWISQAMALVAGVDFRGE